MERDGAARGGSGSESQHAVFRRTSLASVSGYYSSMDTSESAAASGGGNGHAAAVVRRAHTPPSGVSTTSVDDNCYYASDHEREEDDDDDDKGSFEGSGIVEYPEAGTVDLLAVGYQRQRGCCNINAAAPPHEKLQQQKPPYTFTCSLIPSCGLRHWKYCRACYLIVMATLATLILILLAVTIFWLVEIFKNRSHISVGTDLSASEIYNVTSLFPSSNIYSNHLCLDIKQTHSTPSTNLHVNKVVYVSLASIKCSSVFVSTDNTTLIQNSVLGHSYMFYWLKGTRFSFFAELNGSSVMYVYLLTNRMSFDMCLDHITPQDYLEVWQFTPTNYGGFFCAIVPTTGLLDCRLEYEIPASGYYYICVNSTMLKNLQYNFTISAQVYNVSRSKTVVQCVESDECCVPFSDVFEELVDPTCVFVVSVPLDPIYSGLRLTDVSLHVDQRMSVIWYCVVAILPLLIILAVVVLFCRLTAHKVKNPNTDARGCIIHCNLYSNDSKYMKF